MENKENLRTAQETALAPGSLVWVYIWESRYAAKVLDNQQSELSLSQPPERRLRFQYNQPACLVQSFQDQRMLFVLLRYVSRRKEGLASQDVYTLYNSTRTQVWPGLGSLPMSGWCALKVFEPYGGQEPLLDDRVFLTSLTESGMCLLVGRPLPVGAFADCTFPLGDVPVTVRTALTRFRQVEGAPYYEAVFTFIGQQLQEKIKEYLLIERVRRILRSIP